jgi:hypothetical protein
MGPLVTGRISCNGRVELGVPLLLVGLSEIFFRRALAVVTGGVDFIVAMFLEYVRGSGGIFVFMNSCLLDS